MNGKMFSMINEMYEYVKIGKNNLKNAVSLLVGECQGQEIQKYIYNKAI
ncbi:Uncharacterized protein APZ42_000337 [Daphnia magna]|uniref:Uncharacterized protein n=1 Tax=Daphnia magna TaxID=35525 RepID=A0A164JR68_9CRUS|nr:Uncharacterized protein APZ42_000337 [Daphnia magna]